MPEEWRDNEVTNARWLGDGGASHWSNDLPSRELTYPTLGKGKHLQK